MTKLASRSVAKEVVGLFWRIAYASPTPHGLETALASARSMFSAVKFTNATIIDAVCDGIREVVVLDADVVARYQGESVVFMLPRLAQVQTVWLCCVLSRVSCLPQNST